MIGSAAHDRISFPIEYHHKQAHVRDQSISAVQFPVGRSPYLQVASAHFWHVSLPVKYPLEPVELASILKLQVSPKTDIPVKWDGMLRSLSGPNDITQVHATLQGLVGYGADCDVA